MVKESLTCAYCSGPLPPYTGQGRRKQFCSFKCRQRAFFRRRGVKERVPSPKAPARIPLPVIRVHTCPTCGYRWVPKKKHLIHCSKRCATIAQWDSSPELAKAVHRQYGPCLHCGRAKSLKGRGLCSKCYCDQTARVCYVPLPRGPKSIQYLTVAERNTIIGLFGWVVPSVVRRLRYMARQDADDLEQLAHLSLITVVGNLRPGIRFIRAYIWRGTYLKTRRLLIASWMSGKRDRELAQQVNDSPTLRREMTWTE
jgi:hypothetical protein